MIPPDVASRLQANADAALRPVAPTQVITDKLSDLVAGQRVMAEIQALLPNGTYRALINQRSVTLALPFSARSGDALELEVTESDGKLALAVISHQSEGGKAAREAVSATLSRTGQLIGRLFSGAGDPDNESRALPLNGNKPIAETPPTSAREILPLLKEAITRSGMFYESHQAEWIEGRFAKSELLQEPQGKLSSPAAFVPSSDAEPHSAQLSQAARDRPAAESSRPGPTPAQTGTESASAPKPSAETAPPQTAGQIVAPQAQGVVHQQLEALASQNFVWQGQIWPGQEMRWEIEEDGRGRQEEDESSSEGWHSRLDLSFPRLGGISARLALHDNQLSLSINVDNETSLGIMQADAETLRRQLNEAGLALISLGIAVPPEQQAP